MSMSSDAADFDVSAGLEIIFYWIHVFFHIYHQIYVLIS